MSEEKTYKIYRITIEKVNLGSQIVKGERYSHVARVAITIPDNKPNPTELGNVILEHIKGKK